MARGGIAKLKMHKLKTRKPSRLSDGGNLYLQTTIGKGGTIRRSWILRFKLPGRPERDMGLGSLDTAGLARARQLRSGISGGGY
jgi:hypothetical protein